LLTGILYIILEIRQHNFMWVVGILTSLGAMYTFLSDHLLASFLLNSYYLITAVIGLWQWNRDSKSHEKGSVKIAESSIRLRGLTVKTVLISIAAFVVLTPLFSILLSKLGDPRPGLDVVATMISVIATVWLIRCYKEQWLLWIVADILSTSLCLRVALSGDQGMWWMTLLYVAYTVSAVYGYFHWKNHGQEIS